jgi:8-oxo-dGTP diphosphatase
MHTRLTASAFLTCGGKILLMKRGLHKELGPGLWAGIGGHLDMCDIANPRAIDLTETCYREVFEETGIPREDIRELTLKYVTMRYDKDGEEIRSNYYFMGKLEREMPLPDCDEGELHWVDIGDIDGLTMINPAKYALTHWLENPDRDRVHLVITNAAGDRAEIVEL